MAEVYERLVKGGKEKMVDLNWEGLFDKGMAELVGYTIISEEHNGSDKFIVERKQFKFT